MRANIFAMSFPCAKPARVSWVGYSDPGILAIAKKPTPYYKGEKVSYESRLRFQDIISFIATHFAYLLTYSDRFTLILTLFIPTFHNITFLHAIFRPQMFPITSHDRMSALQTYISYCSNNYVIWIKCHLSDLTDFWIVSLTLFLLYSYLLSLHVAYHKRDPKFSIALSVHVHQIMWCKGRLPWPSTSCHDIF